MSGTYKAIGINLKSSPLGESDRLLTILTEEFGLLRAVAPGARKHKSSLSGRSGLFVVNELLMAKGKTLDKIVQAESVESFPGLSQDLRKLTAAQYLAELALYQALSDQPQGDLFCLLQEHLSRMEALPGTVTLPCLVHGMFHLLALAGVTPQVHHCCISQEPIAPNFADSNWRVVFSVIAGGTVLPTELEQIRIDAAAAKKALVASGVSQSTSVPDTADRQPNLMQASPTLQTQLTAVEAHLLQQLAQPDLIQILTEADPPAFASNAIWLPLERVLRHYAQYHFDRLIRSAALIDTCFAPANAPSLQRS